MSHYLNDHTAGEISKYLSDIRFPATKDELIKEAKNRNAGNDVISAIEEMSDSRFTGMADVLKDYGND
jgi:hypothetical protein